MEINQNQLSKIIGMRRSGINNAIKRGAIDINSAGMIDTQNTKNMEWLSARGFSEQKILFGLAEIQKQQAENPKIKSRSMQNPKIKRKIKEKQNNIDHKQIETIHKYFEPQKKDLTTFESSKQKQSDIENKNQENILQKQSTTFESSSIPETDFENLTGLPAWMMDMSLKKVVMRYGGQMSLDTWSKILQRLMAAAEKDQKIQERRIELIKKDFVQVHITAYLETLSSHLFDYAESAPIEIIALVQAGGEMIETELKTKMRKSFSIAIKDTKENISREMENLKRKYEKSDDRNS